MIADLKPYPTMKDSGVEWLGKVPEHWGVLPGRACLFEKQEPNIGMKECTVLSLSYGRIVVKPEEKLRGLVPESFETYQVVNQGDIICRPTDLQNDHTSLRFGISNYRGIITSAYMCFGTNHRLDRRFGHFLFHSYDLKKVFYGLGSGLRQNLSWRDFKYLPCVTPTLLEQATIVRYLDNVDRRVRRLIRAKRKLIALLTEQKQAIIHRAVTRGLDPEVPLKDSGVEWLGKVPEHWEVRRIKQATQILRGKFTHRPRNDPSLYDGPYPFIQTGDVARADKSITKYKQTLNQRGLSVSKIFPTGTLLMTIAANIGDVAVLDFEACFPDSIVGFVPRSQVERDYLFYIFRAMRDELLREAPVNTQGNLNVERIGSKWIVLPPQIEQRRIVRKIEVDTSDINLAIARANREIDLLNEYRTRLIADVVTGKVDVREAAATIPEVDPLTANGEPDDTLDNYTEADLDELDPIPEEDDT